MKCKEIITYLDDWAPPGIAWEKDNVGLQVGSPEAKVQNILLSLELTPEVLEDALKRRCNLIITHHPFLFHSVKRINVTSDKTARLLAALIKKNVTVLSYHTNLDYTSGGVSFRLAETLKLNNTEILSPLSGTQSKLAVYAPLADADKIACALSDAGAGKIGEYTACSFRTEGTGTFIPSSKAHPALGEQGGLNKIPEVRIEVVVDNWKLSKVISAMRSVHPYEEPAYDVYPLQNGNPAYGAGVIGTLERAMPEEKFLAYVKQRLHLNNFRFTRGSSKAISKVAVCGGSASEYMMLAAAKGAQAYITADIRYHDFHDALGSILLIDAGHYETEIVVLDEMKARLQEAFPRYADKIFITNMSTNPVEFYK